MPFEERWQARQRLVLDYETQVIEALPAAKPITTWLNVPPGYALLKETNVATLLGGQAAGLFTSYYRHEYYQFHSIAHMRDQSPNSGKTNSKRRQTP